MILKSITPRHFGPFIGNTTLHFDPEVTVLTGPNDVGKSLALRAIQLLCTKPAAEEREVNWNRFGEFDGKWNDDPDVCCEAEFELTQQSVGLKGIPQNYKPGTLFRIRKRLNVPSNAADILEARIGNTKPHAQGNWGCFPQVLSLPLQSEVRPKVEFGSLTEAEKHLLWLGFGGKAAIRQLSTLDDLSRAIRIDAATTLLNERLLQLLPLAMPMQLKLTEVSKDPFALGVSLIDQQLGYFPVNYRGTGLRKLLNIAGALLQLNPTAGPAIIIFDEPESSLHSDAQHMLRRFLEGIAAQPTFQVVYSTHSPAMINTLRPNSIRVLERRRDGDKAISCFTKDTFSGNYARVRSSLGITPADSLLYSPITIVVEGITEVLCLPLVFDKLAKAGTLDKAQLDVLLPLTHILDGEGDTFEHLCRLAKSQGAHPILFLDGDKSNRLTKVCKMHSDVPIVLLPERREFEQIVPQPRYIEAVAGLLGEASTEITDAGFTTWQAQAALHEKMAFSKRVDRWIEDKIGYSPHKPSVMAKAIELTDAAELDAAPFVELVEKMKTVSERL